MATDLIQELNNNHPVHPVFPGNHYGYQGNQPHNSQYGVPPRQIYANGPRYHMKKRRIN